MKTDSGKNKPSENGVTNIQDLVREVVMRLDNIADVLQSEHHWLRPLVVHSREIDDDGIEYELSAGHIDSDEAAEKKAEDNLLLRRSQVDKNLENISRASDYIKDISLTMKGVFGAEGEALEAK